MGPWVYSDSSNQSTEISCCEINEFSTNSSAPLDLYESDDVRQSELAIGNSSENEKRKGSRKEGEENSDEEETATSVPATTENREGNAVVIACGQHNETIRMEASKMRNGKTSDTGQKKQSERKVMRGNTYEDIYTWKIHILTSILICITEKNSDQGIFFLEV